MYVSFCVSDNLKFSTLSIFCMEFKCTVSVLLSVQTETGPSVHAMADLIPDSWRLKKDADMPKCCYHAKRSKRGLVTDII